MKLISQEEFTTFETNNLRLIRKGRSVLEKVMTSEEKMKKILDQMKAKIKEL